MATIKQTKSSWEEFEKSNPQYPAVHVKYKQGLSNYLPDSYGILRDRVQGQQGQPGPAGAYADILQTFSGSQKHLSDFLRTSAPFIAGQVAATPEWTNAQNYQGRSDVLNVFGAANQKLQAAGVNAGQRSAMALKQSGLGTSGAAMSGIQSQIQHQTASQQSNIYSALSQEQQRRRMDYSQGALGNQMALHSLVLGMNPQPRTGGQQGGSRAAGIMSGAGSGMMAGAAIGSVIPGVGTVIGAAAGGVLGGLGGAFGT